MRATYRTADRVPMSDDSRPPQPSVIGRAEVESVLESRVRAEALVLLGPGSRAAAQGADFYVRSRASPKGLPSVSRQMLHRSPGWMTSPPSERTRCRAEDMSATEKYGSDTRSPGPVPRGWRPIAEPCPRVCHPSPSPSTRPSSSTFKSPPQNPRARAGSSAGNSTSRSGEVTPPR
jgi:hypothetical protein